MVWSSSNTSFGFLSTSSISNDFLNASLPNDFASHVLKPELAGNFRQFRNPIPDWAAKTLPWHSGSWIGSCEDLRIALFILESYSWYRNCFARSEDPEVKKFLYDKRSRNSFAVMIFQRTLVSIFFKIIPRTNLKTIPTFAYKLAILNMIGYIRVQYSAHSFLT